ncbi:hypothetical protein ACSBR2_034724 [Camellia fascicularis]
MTFEMASSNRYSRSAADMGFSLEVKRSSRPRESSKVVKQKIPSPQANQILESQDKHKIEGPFGHPYLDLYHESRRSADDALLSHPKSSRNSQKPWIGKKANKDDELIKHMSNLPGYLQQVEKGENFQEKALNFGVLDWGRLEKWKYNKKHSPRGNNHASLAGSNSSTVQSKSLAPHKKKLPSHCPHLNSYHKEGFSQDVKQSQGKAIQQDFEITPKNTLDALPKPHQTDKSSGRNYSEIKLERGMRKDADQKITLERETSLSGLRKHGFSHVSKREKRAQSSVATYRVEELQESEYYLGKKHSHGEHKSVVVLLPKHPTQKSCSEIVQPSELKAPFHAKPREANRDSFPNGFATEVVHSAELYHQIPRSCPLPLGVETNSESGMRPRSLTHTQSMELPNDACRTFMCPNETPVMLSQCKCIDENASSVNPSNANAIDAPKSLDHEATEPATVKGSHSSPNHQFSFSLSKIRKSLSFKERAAVPQFSSTYAESTDLPYDASCTFICPNDSPNTPSSANAIRTSKHLDQETTEPAAVKGSYPPPNRRFNFTLGMMSRSFSSKEGSSVPQLSSTFATVKSGPVRSEVSDSLDNASKSKANTHSRTRSSPLRRLLDPLLKTRVTSRHHSAETIQQLTRNLNLTSEVTSSTESVQDKSHEGSTVQALVQLTMKNGLPLFKLVINNDSDILFATKKINSLSKDDAEWIYTFYSVHEIKKKSGSWISHGHKGKGYDYGYNIVGQMKILSSCYPDLMVQSSKDQFTVRESVLYSGNLRQVDEGTQELMPNGELAAIIVKIPIGNSCNDGDRRNKGKESVGKRFLDCLQEDGNSFENGETENFNSTTVILPGGAHGLPNKGVPSPLIERWKSGGSCDCGGWDVGCKLRILANDNQSCQFPGPSISFSNPDHFDLFDQGGAQDGQPIFSLAPFKEGIYSVEFSSSISLLQAFSICVEVISNQKSFEFSEVNNLSEAKLFHELAFTRSDRRKTPTNVREVPTNYVPAPPPSPVGRV